MSKEKKEGRQQSQAVVPFTPVQGRHHCETIVISQEDGNWQGTVRNGDDSSHVQVNSLKALLRAYAE